MCFIILDINHLSRQWLLLYNFISFILVYLHNVSEY